MKTIKDHFVMMRKALFAFALLGTVVLAGCDLITDQVGQFTEFDIPYTHNLTIPAAQAVPDQAIEIGTPAVPTDIASKLGDNDSDTDLVSSIVLSAVTLRVTTPDMGNFDFLKSMSITMNAAGQDPATLGSITSVPTGSNELVLEVSDTNLKDYLLEDEFSLTFSITPASGISEDHEIAIETVFTVDAEILGL